jgi:MFS family permease
MSLIAGQQQPSRQSLRALDYLNFLLADVRGGVGPFLAIYLLSTLHWNPAEIGVILSVMGIATLVAQTPCGALVDALKPKRLLLVVSASLVGASCLSIAIFSNYYLILTSQIVNGVVDASIAAITLGIVAHQNFAPRVGRNEMFNHAGNVGAALLAGISGPFSFRQCGHASSGRGIDVRGPCLLSLCGYVGLHHCRPNGHGPRVILGR